MSKSTYVFASSMMVVAASLVVVVVVVAAMVAVALGVEVVAVEDGLALKATLPLRAEIIIHPASVTGRHISGLTTVGVRQAVT